jgi:hypothetical protein
MIERWQCPTGGANSDVFMYGLLYETQISDLETEQPLHVKKPGPRERNTLLKQ